MQPTHSARSVREELKIVLLHGISGSGKTFATERVLALEYHVATCRMDTLYAQALEHAGIPRRPDNRFGIPTWSRKLHRGKCDHRISAVFFTKLSELIWERVREAHAFKVAMVLEGYTLRFPDEARLVRQAAEAIAGSNFVVSRVHLTPSPEDWRRNRAAKLSRGDGQRAIVEDVDKRYRKIERPEPVEGVDDYSVADVDEMCELVEKRLGLRRFNWYQHFTLGPVSTHRRIDSSAKLNIVLDDDLAGRKVLDICCNTGAHAIMAKNRGAAKVVGVERNPRTYCKALELKNVLRRQTDVDAKVEFLLGDVVEILPTLGRFDTILFFAALHYFPDHHEILRSVADAAATAAYVEFRFSEGVSDTATAPGALRPCIRNNGKTIYMGDRDTIARTVREAMPGFEISERTPMPRRGSDREIWRLRRT